MMVNSWQHEYEVLKDFVAKKYQIKIEVDRTSIPGEVRPEFYRLFNIVRSAFIKQNFQSLLDEAGILIKNYLQAKKEVTELLELDSITVSTNLGNFLSNPQSSTERILYISLFDLLKGKLDIKSFRQKVVREIDLTFREFSKLGYEKWVLLSLLKLLDPDKTLQVSLPQPSSHELVKYPPTSKKPVPPAQESKNLSFVNQLCPVLTVPNFIVHLAGVGKYFAVRSGFIRPIWVTSNASKAREWYPLDSMVALESGLTLIYIDENPEEISLVADRNKVCRPDLVIECMEQKGWFEKEGLEKVKLYHNSLKPRLRTYMVSKEPVLEQGQGELVEGINLLTVGFEQSKLGPIVSALMQ